MGLFPCVLSSLARQLDLILHLLLARSILDTAGALPATLETDGSLYKAPFGSTVASGNVPAADSCDA